MLEQRVDIIIRTSAGNTVALVEIKNLTTLTRDVAIELHQQISTYVKSSDAAYSLLVSQEVGFVWHTLEHEDTNALPVLEFQMYPVITRFMPTFSPNSERLGESQFQYLVMQWLSELEAGLHQQPLQEPELSLAAIGFLAAIHNTLILFDVSL